jgi:hypothetical protein
MEEFSSLQWQSISNDSDNLEKKILWLPTLFHGKITSIKLMSIKNIFVRNNKDVSEQTKKKLGRYFSESCCLIATKERTLDLTFKNKEEMMMVKKTLLDIIKSLKS